MTTSEILLLADVPGIGGKYDIVPVDDATRLKLMSERVAFAATPLIRQRFSSHIKTRAEERSKLSA
jgi:hypothetical protein